jgi:hypothetical protein
MILRFFENMRIQSRNHKNIICHHVQLFWAQFDTSPKVQQKFAIIYCKFNRDVNKNAIEK